MPPQRLLAILLAIPAAIGPGAAAEPPLAAVTATGPLQVVFRAGDRPCGGVDVPDAPARAYRDADGEVVLFAPHYDNRPLRGPSLDRLTLDCRTALPSAGRPEPEAYDDRSWITATWTRDGRAVAALVHHEYQANTHPGRCRHPDYMACWYNTVIAAASRDGGRSFERPRRPVVVAGAPFGQDHDQGRHRGFFNPSNIFGHAGAAYMFAATTGWAGQPSGACLFRSADPLDPGGWRAFDGQGFTVAARDPYRTKAPPPAACKPIEPFPAPVGGVVRHRGSGAYLAVFQAKADGGRFPESGFYATASRDLVTWDKPRLILAGRTLYDDPCTSGPSLISYPSLIDPQAEGRNFDDVGDSADLYYTRLRVEGCQVTSDRDLVRRRAAVKVWP